jgi:hypothetical protein
MMFAARTIHVEGNPDRVSYLLGSCTRTAKNELVALHQSEIQVVPSVATYQCSPLARICGIYVS